MPYRATDINANLTKGSADIPEVIQLLRAWEGESEPPGAFQDRAIEANLLGKTSRRRVKDIVKRVLAVRYFPEGSTETAVLLKRILRAGFASETVNKLLYYHAALGEHLLYVIATEFLFDHQRRGLQTVATPDVERFLEQEAEADRIPEYSVSVEKRIAQHALAALRDFGILEGKVKKRIAPVRVPPELTGYVVHALKDEGLSANRIVEHTDWRLFLLDQEAAEDAIITASQHGYFSYSAAGTIRRFDWEHDSLEEYVHAIT